jgi:cytochrome c553
MVMGAPKLGGQKADYLTKALMDYKTGIRNNAVMSAFSSTLSSAEMIAIGKYFESQTSTLTVPK